LLAQFDSFGNFEIPQITLCNPDGRALGILSNLSDRQMNIRFNDLSDLSFTIQRGAKECRCPVYEQVEPFRYLLVDGIGYFVITDVSVSEEGNDAFKTVEASSCEYELNNIQLGYYEGTYRFYSGDDSDPKNSLLSDIMKRLPSWRLDTDGIPAAVAARSRTFDTTDQTVYAFLMTELEEAYECLFEFDILNRVIRVYDRYQYDNRTDICLSTEDVLQGLTLRTKSDEIKTALLVKGGNGLDILSVNPLGTNLIYNFSYYATEEWMDAALIEKVKNWQAHVDALTSSENSAFQVQRAEISKLQGRKAEKEGEITRLKQELSNLQVQQSAIISDTASQDIKNANLKALHPQILAAKSALSTAEGALSSIQTQLNTENNKLLALQKQVRLESVFTPAEMEVLSRFIQQGAYTEENITKQDNMSYEEAQAQALELYNKAQSLLKTISTPRYEYSVETASFVFQKEFAHLTSQLKSGCLIDIRLSEEDIASLLLLEMAVDYDGRSLSLTFGNRYKLSDPSALFNDLVGGSIAKTASTVEYLRTTFDFKQQKDDLDHLAELKDESINLTHNMVVNADNQVMVIDASGINGRRAVIGEDGLPTGDYEPEVLKITNNTIAFSTDDFETTETVLGKNLLPDGATTPDGKNYMYGLNAKLLMGDLIIGENLKVSGEIEGRLINAKGLTVNNGVTDTLRVDENGDVSLNVKSLSITGNQVATQGDLTSGINGLQIGSRNYIKDSVSRTLTANSTSDWYYNNLYTGLENTQYTFSVGKISVISGSATKVSVLIYDINNAKLIQTMYLNVSNSKQQISFTPPPSSAALSLLIYAGVAGSTAGNSLKYEHMKLEKGSKATDWTPAPEDRSYLINTLSPTQADGLWLGSDGKLNITATQIKAGRLQSKDGSSYFDLENGVASLIGTFSAQALTTDSTLRVGTKSTIRGFNMPNPPTNVGSDIHKLIEWINSLQFAGLYFYDVDGGEAGSVVGTAFSQNGNGVITNRGIMIRANNFQNCRSYIALSDIDVNGRTCDIDLNADNIYMNNNKAYHSGNIQSGEAMVPNGSLSGSIYTGETTVYFSPAFSKAPRVIVTPRTGAPYTVQAAVGGPPTANSVKIIVQRNTKTADGYTAVQWIAVEPR
jgi:hypothetical protein